MLQVKVYNFLTGNRYRKYLELQDSNISSYYIDNYQRYSTVDP